jgi:hypothetical protein
MFAMIDPAPVKLEAILQEVHSNGGVLLEKVVDWRSLGSHPYSISRWLFQVTLGSHTTFLGTFPYLQPKL